MSKAKPPFDNIWGKRPSPGAAIVACALAFGANLSSPGLAQEPPEAAHVFEPIASVLQSPRCMNCHPRGDRPGQTDSRRIHLFNVQRGIDGHGPPAMRCAACHMNENNDRIGIPGAPNWHLAPSSMGWQGLTKGDLCRAILDTQKNGNRSVSSLAEHMTSDPLVLWAWSPGKGRTQPPLSLKEVKRALNVWVAAGTPCPK